MIQTDPTTVGIAWYRRDDYPRILEIMEDAVYAAGFPPSYDEWLIMKEHEERDEQSNGKIVSRIIVDPDEFVAWCREKNLKFDEEARAEFVLWLLFKQELEKE
jgi:hypothetical protein